MKIWELAPGLLKLAVIRSEDAGDEAWSTLRLRWVQIGADGLPTDDQLVKFQPFGQQFGGQVVQWAEPPEDAMISGSAVVLYSLNTDGSLAGIYSVRPALQMVATVVY
jgi:hypothetical protein